MLMNMKKDQMKKKMEKIIIFFKKHKIFLFLKNSLLKVNKKIIIIKALYTVSLALNLLLEVLIIKMIFQIIIKINKTSNNSSILLIRDKFLFLILLIKNHSNKSIKKKICEIYKIFKNDF
jgi:hypothetical protein